MQIGQMQLRLVRDMVFTADGESILVAGITSLPSNRVTLIRFDPSGLTAPIESNLLVPTDRAIAIHPTSRLAVCLRSESERDYPAGDAFVGVYKWDDRASPQMCGGSVNIRSIYGLAFARAGDRVAVTCDFSQDYVDSDFGVFVWDIASSRELFRFRTPGRPGDVLLSPDDRTLIVASGWSGILWTFDLPTGYFQTIDNIEARRIAISSRGKYLAIAGKRFVIWDLEGMYRESFFRGQDEDVPSLAFSPDERILAVARTDGPVEFWEVESGQLLHRYEWNIGRLGAIAFAPDGLTCAVAGDRGRIVIWDVDV